MIDDSPSGIKNLLNWIMVPVGVILSALLGRYSLSKQAKDAQIAVLFQKAAELEKNHSIISSQIADIKNDIHEIKEKLDNIIEWLWKKR